MSRSEQRERFRPAATVARRQEWTREVAKLRRGSIPAKLSTPNTQLGALAPGELVTVHTRNSTYRLIILDPTEQNILIQGGRHFPCSTEACLLDGSCVLELLVGGAAVGCNLEFVAGDRCFITSPIVEIEREGTHVIVA
jgi:hypothetical protein